MEFKPTEKKNPTICLNMIVKNESHIIENTLEKLCKKISFDYWVICDTGSTDNTVKIITDFFKTKGIQGELFHDEWQNFAHNRTLALKRAYKKTDLLLVFDADDEIVGDIVLPSAVLFDEYHLKFGSGMGVSYTRVLLINNHKKFQFLSVIHEFINCIEGPTTSSTINSDYYVISGRSGSRSLDPDKYLKDAVILGKAYHVALADNDQLFHRYAFYCANSYKDCGQFENAINWYKITLSHEKQWPQEKYVSCLYIFDCLNALNRKEEGFFYLVKSFQYDNERVECLYPLLVHYCCENMPRVAYNYYLIVKEFYENKYVNTDISNKLFVAIDKFDFFVPYYMILIADKVQDFSCVIKMYEIVFNKKPRMFEDWYVKNFLYNLQFFLQHVSSIDKNNFISLANDYIQFLNDNGIQFENYDFVLKDVYRNAGINFDKYILKPLFNKSQIFDKVECSNSKNILIYTGFSDIDWNYTYTLNNALGGSEKAVAYLSKCFPKEYTIYISGHVKNETIDNIHYIPLDELTNLINRIPFHTLIVSRYISFYEMFPTCSFYQSYIWAHDVLLLPYGSNLNDNQILKKWDNYINGCICLTEWHRNLFSEKYPILKDKITIINNGIDIDSFKVNTNNKIKNRFIYTSRPDRGLNNLLNLWPQILEKIPDATLTISSYGFFPSNPQENELKNIIDQNSDTIHYLGKLKTEKLYEEMSKAEFWLYPTHWPETSCITALEMLMSEVICLYYPVAGLTNTMDKYGIQVSSNEEIETIVKMTESLKNELRENGKKYALSCSWEARFMSWDNLIFGNNDNIKNNDEQVKKRIYELYYSNSSIPSDHVNFLKKLRDEYHFEPKVIYDIGANVLHWTKEAKNIWNNSEIIVFDAITTAKFLYEEQKLKHYIGVLSDEDNKIVKFYENIEHPAGNSYYQEIGHTNSKNLYSDNSFTEQNSTTLTNAVNSNKFPYPDLIKMDVQGAELDIIKGSLEIINKAQYLIVELQHTQYNKGAPLRDVTISFLNKNGWKLIAEKFSDNGADADYCFINTEYKKWLFFIELSFNKENLKDFIDSLNSVYNIEMTSDIDYILNTKFNKVSFISTNSIQELTFINIINKLVNDNSEISILNTEPLNLEVRLNILCNNYNFLQNFVSYPIIIYDYSLSNIRILNETNIKNTIHLEYIPYKFENDFLTILYKNTEKIYDFGIISENNPISHKRRRKVVDYLISNGYKLNIISGWKESRDCQLSKCKTILNIHGELLNQPSLIFEHIRCDRLLHAGFQILSETSLYLDDEFINKFPNLRFINYEDFFKKETYISNYYIKKNKVIDCFIFYNELELLDYRLNLLNDVVDYFILVESTKTFIGKDKPLIYYQNKELFSKFNEKIIHIIVDDMPFDETNINVSNGDQWVNEKFQRNCISRGFNKINFENNDIITICDLDEIPDPIVLLDLKNSNQDIGIQILELDFYYYNLNCKRREKWYHTKVLSYKKYIELNTTCENIRFSSGSTIKKAGWHLSYFGDVNFIKNKINNFSHQEYNNETYTNIEKLQKSVETCSDLYERSGSEMDNIDIKDNDYLPPLYNIYLKNYYKKSINYQDIDYVTNENNNF
jgi:beta-1,4-mannosyl-glycoprotein beta-1,4-N-acetylglucosaminyltransferase